MRIAVIGWGSLLWEPEGLKIQGKWRKDGPELPVEFSRKSGKKEENNERMTLVLVSGASKRTTYWVLHQSMELSEAREDLRIRERCSSLKPIHSVCHPAKGENETNNEFSAIVREWLNRTNYADAAIWTGLRPTDEGKSAQSALDFLNTLSGESKENAEKYIRKAPPQIQTAYRSEFRTQLGWNDEDPTFWDKWIE